MHALPPRLLIAFMCLSLADCSTARAMASGRGRAPRASCAFHLFARSAHAARRRYS